MREVEDALVVRVRVDRGHEALLHGERVVEHLGERRHAVRRARRVGDHVVRAGVVLVVVDAEHDGDVGLGRRRGDDDLPRARVDVLLRLVALGEEAGRLDYDLDAEVAPRQRGRVALGQQLELLAGRPDDAVAGFDVPLERPRFESYLSRCAIVFASPRSFAATISKSASRFSAARKKFRPIRPNPLIPTRTAMSLPCRSRAASLRMADERCVGSFTAGPTPTPRADGENCVAGATDECGGHSPAGSFAGNAPCTARTPFHVG